MAASQKRTQERLKPLERARHELDRVLTAYSGREFLQTDPIQIPHRYGRLEDQEIAAFLAAIFAFGNVRAIINATNSILEPLEKNPAETLRNLSSKEIQTLCKKFYYRFFSSSDISHFLCRLSEITQTQSLGDFFKSHWSDDTIESLSKIRHLLTESARMSPGLKFMFPDPKAGAAKRFHMFMRWMVRKDEIDMGLWKFAHPKNLIVPLDTHVFQICRGLRMTPLNSPSLKAALQITDVLKRWDENDPIKYDFAICRVGVLKQKTAFISGLRSRSKV